MSDMKPVALRLPDDLAIQIDARVGEVGGVSRNEWIVRALRLVLSQPPTTVERTERV